LVALLESEAVLAHPFVVGELALGNLPERRFVLARLGALPPATVASDAEALSLIETRRLFGLGIGYVDLHLAASALLTVGSSLWTRDRRLHAVAVRLGVAATNLPVH
jgi:predicted nucleic acid-binding protein